MAASDTYNHQTPRHSGISFKEENPCVKLLSEEPLEKWNRHAEACGFYKKEMCKAKLYNDAGEGQCLSPVCPWTNVQHLRADRAFLCKRRCCTHLAAYFYYGNLSPILDIMLQATYKVFLPGASNHICFIVTHLYRSPIGIIANEETGEFVGYFDVNIADDAVNIFKYSHFGVSRDRSALCLSLDLRDSSVQSNSLNLYVKASMDCGVIGYLPLRVLVFNPTLCIPHVSLVSLSDKRLAYVVVPRSKGGVNNVLYASSFDFHDNSLISKSADLNKYLSNGTTVTSAFGIQNIIVSPDDSLLLVCIEELSEERLTQVRLKLGRIIILNVQTMTALTCITTHLEIDYWWTLENFCCFSNVTPDFSKSGYQIAVAAVRQRKPGDVSDSYISDRYATYISVFQLPHLHTDLRSQCRQAIREHIDYIPDINKLNLPDLLKDYIKFRQIL